ncbi:hypothetical protein SPF06_18520 [Sinomonas sp. JGH33]|uniref:Uncharacterized protein n=1 Tax=Sinomonas terricola TaxID=3110330 RepID=A0ABU5TAK7_9MICC|nr:hypothetical protein [Sinomonas sp. JGH33]MEA5456722.1 hypothetical protein [Sinomonas sp. JGH33]
MAPNQQARRVRGEYRAIIDELLAETASFEANVYNAVDPSHEHIHAQSPGELAAQLTAALGIPNPLMSPAGESLIARIAASLETGELADALRAAAALDVGLEVLGADGKRLLIDDYFAARAALIGLADGEARRAKGQPLPIDRYDPGLAAALGTLAERLGYPSTWEEMIDPAEHYLAGLGAAYGKQAWEDEI